MKKNESKNGRIIYKDIEYINENEHSFLSSYKVIATNS